MRIKSIKVAFVFLILLTGCSGGYDSITHPDERVDDAFACPVGVTDVFPDGSPSGGMGMLGLFNLSIDTSNATAELNPIRKTALTDVLEVVDITNFLQLYPCQTCAHIKSVSIDDEGRTILSIGIKHPFAVGNILKPITGRNRADLHVFNIEGIVVSNAPATSFLLIGESIAGFRLANADGYTGYLDDSLDAIFSTAASIHPYILHFDDYTAGNFSASNEMGFQSVTDPPPSGNLVMAMGCDYNYQDYVFKVLNDSMDFILAIGCTYGVTSAKKSLRFAPEYRVPQHNKKAASEVTVEVVSNNLKSKDKTSTARIEVRVVDVSHGVAVGDALDEMLADSSVSSILVDLPGVTTVPVTISGSSAVSGTGHDPTDPLVYECLITNVGGASEGTYTGLVKVVDSYRPGLNQSPLLYSMDGIQRVSPTTNPLMGLFAIAEFCTYQIFSINIEPGWGNVLGGSEADYGRSVAMDNSGNAYVTGEFRQTVDFNTGSGVDERTSKGSRDVFLIKFNSSAEFQWAGTWGASSEDAGYGVAVDNAGNAYVTGCFSGTVDFDPDEVGEDNHTSNGGTDIFLSKFDPSGAFLWARTWGGSMDDYGYGIAIDGSNNIYVTGGFQQTVDFDPGPMDVNLTSKGLNDVFVCKYNSSGVFTHVRTWGSSTEDIGFGVTLDPSGNCFVTGYFTGLVDFDPSLPVYNRTSNGMEDIFMCEYNSAGDFLWARTWGGTMSDIGYGAGAHGSGNVYVTGTFEGTVDFDPGTVTVNRTSNGGKDIFLSSFSSSGSFGWINTFGGISDDQSRALAVHASGSVYITGWFSDIVDFDPSSGIDIHESNGIDDVFLCKFHSVGAYLWGRSWGGILTDGGLGVAAIDVVGNVYTTGFFSDIVDFDPGPEEVWHTSNGETDIFVSRLLTDGSW